MRSMVFCTMLPSLGSAIAFPKGAGRGQEGELVWMHIPKTGSSFIFPFISVLCPRLSEQVYKKAASLEADEATRTLACHCQECGCSSCPNSWHTPYNNRTTRGRIVAMFRKPSHRIVSQFLYKEGFGGGWGDMSSISDAMSKLPPDATETERFITYATHPSTMSCQTKMLLGYTCVSDQVLSLEDKQEAIRRVREDFAFVGNTDLWHESVTLLHAMLGGKYSPHQELNVRPQSGPASNAERLLTALKEKGWTDPYDDAVFKEVMHQMTKRIGHDMRTVDMQWLPEDFDGDLRRQDTYCTSCNVD